jgi:hypothetical protein
MSVTRMKEMLATHQAELADAMTDLARREQEAPGLRDAIDMAANQATMWSLIWSGLAFGFSVAVLIGVLLTR